MKRDWALFIIPLLCVVLLVPVLLAGCSSTPPPDLYTILDTEGDRIAANQQRLMQSTPAPELQFSNERANIAKRATIFSDPNKLSYIYLLGENGVIMGFFTVKGKVSCVSSYLVPDEQYLHGTGATVQAPDIDGSYGTNGSGVFWFDAQGVYHEWNGLYFLSDSPVKMTQQPLLIDLGGK